MSETEQTPQEQWEQHNEGFRYSPPDKDPALWPSEEYTKLYDRVINKQVRWTCQKCSKPFSRLDKARRHVERQHGEQLIQQAENRSES